MKPAVTINYIEDHSYLVGGAVRDQLLNVPTQDRDWVVVGLTTQEMLAAGFQKVGQDFPVFLHPVTREEYALARQERKTGQGYKGFAFEAHENVTLEDDLIRRDLTINAIAQDTQGHFIDPYHGQEDLGRKILRHVSPAFIEDPLRVLRVARFYARYASLGFTIAEETKQLMVALAQSGELNTLVAERVWTETQKALSEQRADLYFQALLETQALEILFPEIARLAGVPQSPKYHPEIDSYVHTIYCLRAAVLLTDDIDIRFAVLIHDVGKGITAQQDLPSHPDHEEKGVALVHNICNRLKVSRHCKDLAIKVCRYHLLYHRCFEMNEMELQQLFKNLDAFRQVDLFKKWLIACQADQLGVGLNEEDWQARFSFTSSKTDFLLHVYEIAAAVDFKPHIQGLKGPEIGLKIVELQHKVIAEAMVQWQVSHSSGDLE